MAEKNIGRRLKTGATSALVGISLNVLLFALKFSWAFPP
jgi:hypothetical protein